MLYNTRRGMFVVITNCSDTMFSSLASGRLMTTYIAILAKLFHKYPYKIRLCDTGFLRPSRAGWLPSSPNWGHCGEHGLYSYQPREAGSRHVLTAPAKTQRM